MSKRAEAAALKAYPKEEGKVWSSAFGTFEFDKTAPERTAYQAGYEQAEKELALTWEDVAKIDAIILDTNNEFAVDYSKKISRQKFYEDVLKRFNEIRKK